MTLSNLAKLWPEVTAEWQRVLHNWGSFEVLWAGERWSDRSPIDTRVQERTLALTLESQLVSRGRENLSRAHSDGVVAVASGPAGQPIGIDFEFRDRAVSEDLAAKFVRQSEVALGIGALQIWTLKEAALKARGRNRVSLPVSAWEIQGTHPLGGWHLVSPDAQAHVLSEAVQLQQGQVWVSMAMLLPSL